MQEEFFSVSFYIFECNYFQYKRTVEDYLEKLVKLYENPSQPSQDHLTVSIRGSREIARFIHNYVAAADTVIEHSKRVSSDLNRQEFSCEYENRMQNLKRTFEYKFAYQLRQYVLHKKIPVPTITHTVVRIENALSESGHPLFQESYSFNFSSTNIEDRDIWRGTVKEYIRNHFSVPVEDILDRHFNMVKEFCLWIQSSSNAS